MQDTCSFPFSPSVVNAKAENIRQRKKNAKEEKKVSEKEEATNRRQRNHIHTYIK